jgi:hypothetical protein
MEMPVSTSPKGYPVPAGTETEGAAIRQPVFSRLPSICPELRAPGEAASTISPRYRADHTGAAATAGASTDWRATPPIAGKAICVWASKRCRYS